MSATIDQIDRDIFRLETAGNRARDSEKIVDIMFRLRELYRRREVAVNSLLTPPVYIDNTETAQTAPTTRKRPMFKKFEATYNPTAQQVEAEWTGEAVKAAPATQKTTKPVFGKLNRR